MSDRPAPLPRATAPDSRPRLRDLNVAAALFRALTLDLKKWPKLDAWLHKCWDRPAAKKAKAMRETK